MLKRSKLGRARVCIQNFSCRMLVSCGTGVSFVRKVVWICFVLRCNLCSTVSFSRGTHVRKCTNGQRAKYLNEPGVISAFRAFRIDTISGASYAGAAWLSPVHICHLIRCSRYMSKVSIAGFILQIKRRAPDVLLRAWF